MQRFKQWVQRWWAGKSKRVRRAIAAIIGTTVLLIGITLIVLPGPAILVIPLGLAILATEFVWAQRWLEKSKALLHKAKAKVSKCRRQPVPTEE
jgi:tellurite resistance protein TerC